MTIRRRTGAALLTLLLIPLPLGAAPSDRGNGPGLYLFELSAQPALADWQDPDRPATVDIFTPRPTELERALRESAGLRVTSSGEALRVELPHRATLAGPPEPRHTVASFVIDFDEPSVVEVVSSLVNRHGANPPPRVLMSQVRDVIATRSYRQGFDIASQVARTGEGDCTEHAVLMTALARDRGYPSRVVFGVLLIEHEGEFLAFGHAWSEVHDNGTWHIADATGPELELPDARIRYLPVMELGNEGPGYAMALMSLHLLLPNRVQQVAARPESGGPSIAPVRSTAMTSPVDA